MKYYFALLISLVFISCSNKPQPIKYDMDECIECKMTIVDKKYGAEIISTKGKIYKFDDVICVTEFMNASKLADNDIKKILVINFEKENDFLDVNQASFYVSDDLHSPMNGNAAAFVNAQQAILFQAGKQGIIMDWKELKENLK